MSAPTSVEQIVNIVLTRIGRVERIGDIFEGTPAAQAALQIYGPTRDALLREKDWGFAERNVSLTVLKQAPLNDSGGASYVPPTTWNPTDYPPLPWLFEYGYPDDCLKMRTIKAATIFIPNFNPQPSVAKVVNDNAYTPPRKVIVTNVAEAILVYTGQVTDMATWEPLFVDALVDALARNLAPALTAVTQAGLQTEKLEGGVGAVETAVADMEQG